MRSHSLTVKWQHDRPSSDWLQNAKSQQGLPMTDSILCVCVLIRAKMMFVLCICHSYRFIWKQYVDAAAQMSKASTDLCISCDSGINNPTFAVSCWGWTANTARLTEEIISLFKRCWFLRETAALCLEFEPHGAAGNWKHQLRKWAQGEKGTKASEKNIRRITDREAVLKTSVCFAFLAHNRGLECARRHLDRPAELWESV